MQGSPSLTNQDRSIHMGRHDKLLYSIVPTLASPTIFSGSGSLTLGAIVHNGMPVFLVTRRNLPLRSHFELDMVAAWSHIVVVVERNHAIVHFRVGKKLCQH
jgi:hypothetical protein